MMMMMIISKSVVDFNGSLMTSKSVSLGTLVNMIQSKGLIVGPLVSR